MKEFLEWLRIAIAVCLIFPGVFFLFLFNVYPLFVIVGSLFISGAYEFYKDYNIDEDKEND